MTTANGAFTFVLHSHLPYARQAGMWPHGEEWVHEAIAETYVPLWTALQDLADEGVDYRITVSMTPILGEQLADPLIIEHFLTYAEERAAWAAADIERFRDAGDKEMTSLAKYFHHWYSRTLTTFRDRFGADLLGALKKLQDRGLVEISTCAATHGYLPLLSRDSSIYGQIQTGVDTFVKHFGRRPKAIWLPECAYRPAFVESEGGTSVTRPGLESFLAAQDIRVFFSETHTVEGGRPVGKAAGDAMGIYGAGPRRKLVTEPTEEQQDPGTTFKSYWVGDAAGQTAVLARNNRTGQQVWSGSFGYPGDEWYREFHRKDGVSGMQYWRIGGPGTDLGSKPPYNPERAQERVQDHARHFVGLVDELLRQYKDQTGEYGIISSNYDTELFGHWWFEGVDWLKGVLKGLAALDTVDLTTASAWVDEHGGNEVMVLPESSWGMGGNHYTWLNPETEWMWPIIHSAESRMEQLVADFPEAEGDALRLLNQAARELLLLQSSDWPFLVTTGQAKEYATQRFNEHTDRFNSLADIVEREDGMTDAERGMLAALEQRDNPFSHINYRSFAERQGSAELASDAAPAV
ncbi:MAG TPA: 1,4-alpha-glucan branching protein domain-containing protein [Thermomicrobiales bacterium]|nr:1,4-alpha-glucan branching protein domain-containing protein [Thermomicrobiales bacterium]